MVKYAAAALVSCAMALVMGCASQGAKPAAGGAQPAAAAQPAVQEAQPAPAPAVTPKTEPARPAEPAPAVTVKTEPAPEPEPTKPIPPISTTTSAEPTAPAAAAKTVPATSTQPGKDTLTPVTATSAAPVWVLDSFEKGNEWKAQGWANTAKMAVVDVDGKKALSIELGDGKADKVAIARGLNVDLSGRRKLLLDVSVAGDKEVGVAVALNVAEQDNKSQRYYETGTVKVKPGETRTVSFDIQEPVFKTAPNWERFNAKIDDLSKVQQIIILFYGPEGAKVSVQNVRATNE